MIAGGVTNVNLPFSSRRGAWRNAVFTSTVAQPHSFWAAFDTSDLVHTVHSPPAATSASSFFEAWLPHATNLAFLLKGCLIVATSFGSPRCREFFEAPGTAPGWSVRWPCASRGTHTPTWLALSILQVLFEPHPGSRFLSPGSPALWPLAPALPSHEVPLQVFGLHHRCPSKFLPSCHSLQLGFLLSEVDIAHDVEEDKVVEGDPSTFESPVFEVVGRLKVHDPPPNPAHSPCCGPQQLWNARR